MVFYDRILALLGRLNAWILNLFKNVALVLTAIMTVIILVQVFFRYFLNNALPWPEEVARFMMVWMTFLVAPYAYRKGMNVNVEFVVDRLPKILRALISLFLHIAVGGMAILFFNEGLLMVERGASIRASTIEIKLVYIYFILPISFGMMLVVAFEKVLQCVGDFLPGRRV